MGISMQWERDINQMINYASGSLLQIEISAMKKSGKGPWKHIKGESWKHIKGERDIVWRFKECFLDSDF